MPPIKPMRCRFDDTHGTFTSPSLLTKHYREHHADVWVQTDKPVRYCGYCPDKALKPSSIGQHLKLQHGIDPPYEQHLRHRGYTPGEVVEPTTPTRGRPRFDRDPDARVECELCGTVVLVRHGNVGKHFKLKHPGRRWQEHTRPITPDADTDEPSTALELVGPEHVAIDGELVNGFGLTADDIVASTIGSLASPHRVIPLDSLPAILVWHTATMAMLRDVVVTRER